MFDSFKSDQDVVDEFLDVDEVVGGCGMVVKKSDGFVCPYFIRERREEWNRSYKGCGPCGVDLQVGSNVCMFALDFEKIKKHLDK